MKLLSAPSVMTAFLSMLRPDVKLGGTRPNGYGSGFLVSGPDGECLVTNWHVLTGREPLTDSPKGSAAKPYQVEIALYAQGPGSATPRGTVVVDLYDHAGNATWWVHPVHGRKVDVAVLPLPQIVSPGHTLMPYPLTKPAQPAVISPTSDVSIVGYPDIVRGRTETAIWTRATVASEPELDFDDLPCFLVDARGREGQSGSPVIGYWTPDRPKLTEGNRISMGHDESWELFGVYSGRITEPSDLCRVWKRAAIQEIIDGCVTDAYTNED